MTYPNQNVVPTAEDVLEELIASEGADQHTASLLRRAFTIGRAHELAVEAHRAARALEELAEPDKPTAHPEWDSTLFGLGGGPFEC